MKRAMHIKRPSEAAIAKARERMESLAQPGVSLGLLGEYAVRLAGILGKTNITGLKKAMAVFAADNGILDEGITSMPQGATAARALSINRGEAGVAVLSACAGADVFIYDMGMRGFMGAKSIENRRAGNGTHSIARGPAMDMGHLISAIASGMDAAETFWDKGYRIVGCGGLSVCNTVTSAAVAGVLTGEVPEKLMSREAGDTSEQKKNEVLKRAIEVNNPDPDNVLDVLAKLGGFDIAAMTGFYLGAAYKQMAVVVDGFVSAAAALAAVRLNPIAAEYMFASQESTEPGFAAVMDELGLHAPLNFGMCLGEGGGGPLMFGILEASAALLQNMMTLKEGRIEPSRLSDIRK